jgi:hypothetical protein
MNNLKATPVRRLKSFRSVAGIGRSKRYSLTEARAQQPSRSRRVLSEHRRHEDAKNAVTPRQCGGSDSHVFVPYLFSRRGSEMKLHGSS